MVLLKNNGALPLKNNLSKYYITGPNATSIESLLGNYHGVNGRMTTFMEGIVAAVDPASQAQYRPGTLLANDNVNPIDWVVGDAIHSNATIVVLGINSYIEGEEGESLLSPYAGDRPDYNLPKNQIDFFKKLCEDNPNPVIAVITGGSPMNLAEVQDLADAVILSWYAGEEGGNALADIIFGKVSPSGKLPITFPKSLDQLPAYEDYNMAGRTYRYMDQEPLYPFGFGLTYSSFSFSEPSISRGVIKTGKTVKLTTTVSNTGSTESENVVQVYVSRIDDTILTPLFTLKKMERISLKPGESKELYFEIPSEMLETINEEGVSVLEKGFYKIYIGTSLPTQRSIDLGSDKYVSASLKVR
jgi:beta-glucosidase